MTEPTATPVETLPCPTWCTTDHAEQDRKIVADVERIRERIGETPDWMARWHTRTIAEIPNPENQHDPVRVTLFRDDDFIDPNPDRAVASAEHADTMPPATAVEAAGALLRAAAVAGGYAERQTEAEAHLDRLCARLGAYRRFADDLRGAVGEYETAVPTAHLSLILDKLAERLAPDQA